MYDDLTDKPSINIKAIIKVILIVISSFFWIFFLASSKLSLNSIVIFDLISIFNSIGTNFLLFLIFLPLTSIIILSVIFNSSKEESLILVPAGLLFSVIINSIIFGFNIWFIIFLILYIAAHTILCLILKKEEGKNQYNQSTEWLSKLTIFLIIAVFLSSTIYLLPNQKERANQFEAGIVNLFIADDLGPWINTSYVISKQCTLTNLKYIMTSKEYRALNQKTDSVSVDFTVFMDNLNTNVQADKTTEEIQNAMPDLDTPIIKVKIIDTIKSIPFMGFIENNFAFFFSLVFTSIIYSFLSIAFIIFAALIYLFNKILKEE